MNNVKFFSDVRKLTFLNNNLPNEINADFETLISLTFNQRTNFSKENLTMADDVLEKGKNPGLNIKKLHAEGITGEGVNIAIIDQPINFHHPEYDGKIIKYKNFDEHCREEESSMHGPAVLSLFCGNDIGVAPNSKVLYAAIPIWKNDFSYYPKAIKWIIDQNKLLSEMDKIKVVSISANPAQADNHENPNESLDEWLKLEQLALKNDILIISCSQTQYNIIPGYYDLNNMDDIKNMTIGFPNNQSTNYISKIKTLVVPCSRRTVAEIYEDNIASYCYTGVGGLSWGIPYLCGCLALAWQIDKNLSAQKLMEIVFETAEEHNNFLILNPINLIEKIKNKNI